MDEVDNPIESAAFVPITSQDKLIIYQRRIVEVYRKVVGYRFLHIKLMELWKANEDLHLGRNSVLYLFTIKFVLGVGLPFQLQLMIIHSSITPFLQMMCSFLFVQGSLSNAQTINFVHKDFFFPPTVVCISTPLNKNHFLR